MNKVRLEIRLDLDDPEDRAIWEKLEPLGRTRRIAGKVREALAYYLLNNRPAPAQEEEIPKVKEKPDLLDDIIGGLNGWGQ